MPSLADMRTKAKEAGLMKLDRLIAKRQSVPTNEFPTRMGTATMKRLFYRAFRVLPLCEPGRWATTGD